MTVELSNVPTLETERLILRAPQPRDYDAFCAFYATERSQYVGGPLEGRAAWNAFTSEIGHWVLHDCGMWIVTLRGDDTAIGIVGHWVPANWPETEVGWVLFNAANEGKGYAREASEASVDHAWNVLKWDTIVSYINPGNDPSVALAERLGAVLDQDAPQPNPEKPCLVYRHPKPEAAA